MTTAPRTFAKLAAKCVADCYRESEKQLVFRDGFSTAAVSTLTSIITSAQLAEDISDRSNSMGKLQLCVFVNSTTPGKRTTQQVLWSSIEDMRGALHRTAINTLLGHTASIPPSNTGNNALTSQNEETDEIRIEQQLTQPTQTAASARSSEGNAIIHKGFAVQDYVSLANYNPTNNGTNGTIRSPLRTPSDAVNPFIIPQNVAEEVSFIILEGCGYFNHNSNAILGWPSSYGELYCKHVTFLLQRIYEAKKQLLSKPNMRYESPIPDHLTSRPVKIDGLHESSRRGKRKAPNDDIFHINLSSRSNTQKHVAFAALCVAYGKEYDGAVSIHALKAVLETFRREGDTEIGCNRYRERGSNIKVVECNRRTYGSCLQSDSQNELTVSSNHVLMKKTVAENSSPVAFGTIDLTIDTVNGRSTSNDSLAVCVTHLFPKTNPSEEGTYSSSGTGEQLIDTVLEADAGQLTLNSTVIWNTQKMSRVTVLYNFKSPIGSAILVSYLDIGLDSTTTGAQSDGENSVVARYQAFDPSKAAVISDLKIYPNRRDLGFIRYPHADWYKMRPFRSLVDCKNQFLQSLQKEELPPVRRKSYQQEIFPRLTGSSGIVIGFHEVLEKSLIPSRRLPIYAVLQHR